LQTVPDSACEADALAFLVVEEVSSPYSDLVTCPTVVNVWLLVQTLGDTQVRKEIGHFVCKANGACREHLAKTVRPELRKHALLHCERWRAAAALRQDLELLEQKSKKTETVPLKVV
jgi:hypothetical protein